MAGAKSSVFQRLQLGYESSAPGTLGTVNRRMPNLMVAMMPHWDIKKYRGQGYKATNIAVPNKFWTDFTIDGPATYGELTWLLASSFLLTTPSLADSAYTWSFIPTLSNPDQPATYTMEQGDQISGYRTRYGLVTDFTLTASRDEVKVTGKGIGQQFETGVTLTNIDATYTVTITGTPTGGTFLLTVAGQTTATIAYNAIASAVKSAVEALSTVGSGNSTVTGGPGPGTPWVITLKGTAANQAVSGNFAGLTGGSSPAGTVVAAGGTGATAVENQPIIANQIDIFVDPTFGAIGTTKIPRGYNWELGVTGRWGPDWVFDSSLQSFKDHVELAPGLTLKLTMESNSTSDAFVAQTNAATTKYLRFQCTGPLIGVSSTYLLQIDVPFTSDGTAGFKDQNGVWVADWNFNPMSDATAAYFVSAKLVNATSAL